MKFKISPVIYCAIGINALSLGVVSFFVIQSRLDSQNLLTTRQQGLKTLAQHFKSDTCWSIKSKEPFKLGDLVNVPGSMIGKIPTECVKSPKTQQILQVTYFGDQLVVKNVYSPKELRSQLSIKESQ